MPFLMKVIPTPIFCPVLFKEEATSRAQQLRIDPQCIRPDEEHARSRGSFGEVWRCWLIEKNVGALQKVAVKIIHLRPEDSRSNRRLLKVGRFESDLIKSH